MSGQSSFKGRWAVMAAGGTFNGSSPTWDFITDTIAATDTVLVGQGTRGYRQKQTEQERTGLYDVAGQLTCNPSVGFLSFWLPYVMGGGTATVPAFATAIPAFDIVCDRADGIYKFSGCKISKFALKFASGQLVTCTMDVIGKTKSAVSWAGAALGSSLLYVPLQSADLAVENAQEELTAEDFEFTIDNWLSAKRRMKLTVQDIMEGDREVAFKASATADATMLGEFADRAATPDTGVTMTMTNVSGASSVSCAFTFSRVRFPNRSATAQAEEFILPIEAMVRGTGGGVEFTASLDITP